MHPKSGRPNGVREDQPTPELSSGPTPRFFPTGESYPRTPFGSGSQPQKPRWARLELTRSPVWSSRTPFGRPACLRSSLRTIRYPRYNIYMPPYPRYHTQDTLACSSYCTPVAFGINRALPAFGLPKAANRPRVPERGSGLTDST